MEHSFSLPLNQKHLEQIPRDCQVLFEIVYVMYPYPTEVSYFFNKVTHNLELFTFFTIG